MSSTNYQILLQKLDAFIRKYYKNRLIRGAIYSVGLLIFAFMFFSSLEYFGRFEQFGRGILFYSFLLFVGYILVYFIIIPLFKLYKFGKIITHEQAAQIIGNHFGEVKDKLTNVLQLEALSHKQKDQLLLASIDQKSAALQPIVFSNAINFRENKKYFKYLFAPILLLLVISLISPKIFVEGTDRLVNHRVYIAPRSLFQVEIKNQKLSIPKNGNYQLEASIIGDQIPEKLYIETNGNRYPLNKNGKREYSYTFKNVQESVNFTFYASKYSSKEYVLEVIPNPILKKFLVDIRYPNHTSKQREKVKNMGDLILPEGSLVEWNIETEDADFVNFIIEDSTHLIVPQEQKASFSKKVFKSGNYSFTPSNRFIPNGDTVNYSLQVIRDKFPSITLNERKDSADDNRIYFNGEVTDDYGFSLLTFNYRILHNEEAANGEEKIQSETLPINVAAIRDDFFYFLDLSSLKIPLGDKVEYYFEVWDNDGVNGKKSAKTALKVIHVKTEEELNEESESTNQEIKENLEESISDARKLQKDMENLRKKLSEGKEVSWEEEQEVKRLLDKQNQLEKKLEEIQKQNEFNNDRQKEYKEFSDELLEKQDRLQELFETLMTEEMKEMMEKMQEMMEKMNKDQFEEELEKMDLSNKELEKELDRSLEIFKQMEFEQKLEEVKNELEDLAEKQDDLSERTMEKQGETENLKKEQEGLNEEFENVKEKLDELKKLDNELERSRGMDEEEGLQEEVSDEMKKSTEQLEKNKSKKASEHQKEAAKKMDEMTENLSNMMAMDSGEDMAALRQLLENLLHISFEQEKLMEDYKKMDLQSPEYVRMTQEQKKIKDNTKMVEDSLFALSKRVIELENTINKEISSINNNMQKVIDFMAERQVSLAVSRQHYVMTSINNLALLFDEALQSMQQKAQQKSGEGSCNKPGGQGGPKPGFQSVKKMQEQLNKQLKAMEKSLKEGNKPGGKKPGSMGEGGNGTSRDYAKAAAQQAKIRNELQKMKQRMKDGKTRQGIDGLSKLMEQTETDLVNKRITQQTINRQKDILTRLLESENADREREWDEKRISRQGKDKEQVDPQLYFKYMKDKETEIDFLRTTPVNFNDFYKKKVVQYFKNINQ